jgi:hypothetical protein
LEPRQEFFNFLDQLRKVGSAEAESRRWNSMVLDIGRNMLVVRVRALQDGIVRMGLWVVPVELFVASPDFITVSLDEEWTSIEDESLQDDKPDVVVEKDFSRYTSEGMSAAYEGQG